MRGLRLQSRRLAGRAGRVHDGPLRRLPAAEVPRPGSGDGSDPRPHPPLGHPAHRLPRLRRGGGRTGVDGVHRRGRAGGTLRRRERPPGGGVLHHRRRQEQATARAGEEAPGTRSWTCPRTCRWPIRSRPSSASARWTAGWTAWGSSLMATGRTSAKDEPEAVHQRPDRGGPLRAAGSGSPASTTDGDPGLRRTETRRGGWASTSGKAWIKSPSADVRVSARS